MSSQRRSQRSGSVGESIGAMTLRLKGLKMVADMPTPIKIIGNKKIGGQHWVRVVYSARVYGDISAIVPETGQRVLCEVKTYSGDRLRFSALKPHQVAALNENHENGGLSILIWVSDYGVCCMQWPVPGFMPRKSLSISEATALEWAGV